MLLYRFFCLAAIVAVFGIPTFSQTTKSPQGKAGQQRSLYTVVKYNELYKNIYRVQCEYPLFTFTSPLHEEANRRMCDIMRTHLPPFLAMRRLSQRALRKQASSYGLVLPHSVQVRSRVGLVSRRVISFAVEVHQFTGGATAYEGGRYYLNLFLSGDTVLETRYSDIFFSDTQTTYAVKSYLGRRLQELRRSEGYYEYTRELDNQALDCFILLPGKVRWILAYYHFGGAKAEGTYDIDVPYEALLPIMRPEWIRILEDEGAL